jgi:FkbM family methyltransferase
MRQREFDAALLAAVAQVSDGSASAEPSVRAREAPATGPAENRLHELAGPLPPDVLEADTPVGTLWLDASDTLITPLIQKHRHWEADVTSFLEDALGRGMTFVDVGANIGYFSVLASQLVGPKGRVLAIEPDARTLAILRANLWRNRCFNVTVLPLAAYVETGHVGFAVNPDGRAGSTLAPDHEEGGTVPCARIDDVVTGAIDVMKIDVEKAEHLVIRGAEETIERSPKLRIVAEFWPNANDLLGDQLPVALLEYYESLGFELCLLRPDGTVEEQTPAEILQAGDGLYLMNIVLRRPPQAASDDQTPARSRKRRS